MKNERKETENVIAAGRVFTGIVTRTLGNPVRDWVSDDDDDEIWTWGEYGRAILMGPTTGALYPGSLVDFVGGLPGGFERRSGTDMAGAIDGGAGGGQSPQG